MRATLDRLTETGTHLRAVEDNNTSAIGSLFDDVLDKAAVADRTAPIQVNAATRSGAIAEQLKGIFDNISGAELTVAVDGHDHFAATTKGDPELIIVEVDPSAAADLDRVVQIVEWAAGDVPVIVTCDDTSMTTCRQLMRMGVADVLPQPIAEEDVLGSLSAMAGKLGGHRTPKSADRHDRLGKVISFARACGGAGATTIALESAAYLHRRGESVASVCVLDFDVQYGDVAVSMDLRPRAGIYQILEYPARLDLGLLESCMSRHESGVDVLASPSEIIPMHALDVDTAKRIVRLAQRKYDYVVVDMPHAWTDWTAHVLAMSDLVVMVLPVTVAGVHRTLRTLQLMSDQKLSALPTALVANRVNDSWRFTGRLKETERALGTSIPYTIRGDWKNVSAARDRGVFVADVAAKSKVVTDVANFLESVIDRFHLEQSREAPAMV